MPIEVSGMQWIDHRLLVMQKLVDKYGLYTSHLQNVIADTTKQTGHTLLQGKFEKIVDVKVFVLAAFVLDTLAEAKKFSLLMQKRDTIIIDVVESIETPLSEIMNGCIKNFAKMKTMFLKYYQH